MSKSDIINVISKNSLICAKHINLINKKINENEENIKQIDEDLPCYDLDIDKELVMYYKDCVKKDKLIEDNETYNNHLADFKDLLKTYKEHTKLLYNNETDDKVIKTLTIFYDMDLKKR